MSTDQSITQGKTPKYLSLKVGQVFGRLTITGEPEEVRYSCGSRHSKYPCRCTCGAEKLVRYDALVSGRSKSCGCYSREAVASRATVHGGVGTRLYRIWQNIKERCHNPRNTGYPTYGGRGIKLNDQWREDFEAFASWATANGYSDELTIERKDVNGDYEPDNCTWIPKADQGENRRSTVLLTAFGETKSAARWSRDPRCSIAARSLAYRVRHGWDHESAITTPASHNYNPNGRHGAASR